MFLGRGFFGPVEMKRQKAVVRGRRCACLGESGAICTGCSSTLLKPEGRRTLQRPLLRILSGTLVATLLLSLQLPPCSIPGVSQLAEAGVSGDRLERAAGSRSSMKSLTDEDLEAGHVPEVTWLENRGQQTPPGTGHY